SGTVPAVQAISSAPRQLVKTTVQSYYLRYRLRLRLADRTGDHATFCIALAGCQQCFRHQPQSRQNRP
ncbi:hypothetical protein, partial [Reyranella soli]|uniref:hypothetical protein n=1 Tax=Reyranella soli TaxID=1230389 RepID=UPI001C3FAB2B